MRYFNVALSASLMFLLCILSVAPALAAEDTFVPYNIALGPDGNVYVSASNTVSAVNHIFVFAPDGTLVRTMDRNARNLAFDDAGNFYVVDLTPYKSGRPTIFNITRLDKSGNATVLWSNTSTSNLTVADMAVSPDGVVCFSLLSWQPGSDSYDRCDVCRIGTDGTTRVVYSENITPPGGFTTLAVDANGTIYGAGVSNRITVSHPTGRRRPSGSWAPIMARSSGFTTSRSAGTATSTWPSSATDACRS